MRIPNKDILLNTSSNSENTLREMNDIYEREELVRRLMGVKENTITRTHRVIKNGLFIILIGTGLSVVMIKCNFSSVLYLGMLIYVISHGYYSVEKLKGST